MSFKPAYLFFLLFAGVLIYLLFQITRKGFKGALFGGRIDKTYGEIEVEKKTILWGNIKVHRVLFESGNKIGIELTMKTPLSFQMLPATITKENAKRLIQLLTLALED